MESKEHFVMRMISELRETYNEIQCEVAQVLGDELSDFDDFDSMLSNLEFRLLKRIKP